MLIRTFLKRKAYIKIDELHERQVRIVFYDKIPSSAELLTKNNKTWSVLQRKSMNG